MDTTVDETKPVEETWEDIPEEIMGLTADEINSRIRLIENDIKVRSIAYIYSSWDIRNRPDRFFLVLLGDEVRNFKAST